MDTTMTDFFTRIADSNKQAVESALKLSEITARAQGRLMRHQLAALEHCVEAGSKQAKLASATKDPADAFAKGSELTIELGEQLTTLMRESLDIQAEVQGEFTKWLEASWKTLSASTPSAAPKARAAK